MTDVTVDRRSFLRGAAAVGATGVLLALTQRAVDTDGGADVDRRLRAADNGGYGPLQAAQRPTHASSPDADRAWLALPAGFTYAAFGHTGDALSDGNPTPADHDGMAAFPHASDPSKVWLVRNHELNPDQTPAVVGVPMYDERAAGGTTNLLFDVRQPRLVEHFASIGGTTRNCAGGPTPWGTWLTCEETFDAGPTRPHGYIFEVPSDRPATAAIPLTDMGRFVHEAVAVDPQSGIVYETEDRGTAGFYRFVPNTRARLVEGGRLQMLAVDGRPRRDLRSGQQVGVTLPVTWVPIEQPDPADTTDPLAVYQQGRALGGATFARLEGAWYGDGAIYIVSTSGGDVGEGQVWEYRPRGPDSGDLTLVFESPDAQVLNRPDNITVSPRGGLVLCEDGDGVQFLRGVTGSGRIFDLARNEGNDSEVAGATFSPDGSTLFFNIQSPGVTLAVTGPWQRGAL